MGQQFKASVRIDKISDRQHLDAMSRHSLRLDDASLRRQRPDAALGHALHFSTKTVDGVSTADFAAMRDVSGAYDAHRAREAITVTSQGGMGFHAMISISSDWITADNGQLHDRNNPRNQHLLARAVAWLHTWCGRNSVYAARLDLDETGGGTVDAFVMPVRIDGRTGKPTISTSKALTEIRKKHGERMSFVALQTDWADYARSHLDPNIVRGIPKAETLLDHLEVEQYKAAHTEARLRANLVYEEAEKSLAKLRRLIEAVRDIGLAAAEREQIAQLEVEASALSAFIDKRPK